MRIQLFWLRTRFSFSCLESLVHLSTMRVVLVLAATIRSCFFWRRLPEEKQKIYRSTWNGQTWSTPQVQSFSTDREDDPYLRLDGNTLFFSSERAHEGRPNLGNFDTNLWRVSRTGDSWGEPILVDADFNTVQDKGEEWPSSNAGFVSSLDDSLFYICTMMKGDSAIRLYEYQRLQDESFSRVNQVTGLFENPNIWVHGAVRSLLNDPSTASLMCAGLLLSPGSLSPVCRSIFHPNLEVITTSSRKDSIASPRIRSFSCGP